MPQSFAPSVYWFDPHCEAQIALGRPGFTPGRLPRQLTEDLETLPMFCCAPGDLLLVRRRPCAAFLNRLQGAGFCLPEFVECSTSGPVPSCLAGRPLRRLCPWGWSPDSAAWLAPLRSAVIEPPPPLGIDQLRQLYSKAWSATLLDDFLRAYPAAWLSDRRTVGLTCRSLPEVESALTQVSPSGAASMLIKALFGQSGRQRLQVRGGKLDDRAASWVCRMLAAQGGVVVEERLDRCADLSLQLEISTPGQAAVHGWSRFLTDDHGRYRGSLMGGGWEALHDELRNFLNHQRLSSLAGWLAEFLAGSLADSCYVGPLGVDLLVHRTTGGLRLKPIVELNPRFTMGRVALGLAGHVAPQQTAVWLILGSRELHAAGFAAPAAFAAHLESSYPPLRGNGRLQRGVLFTTDPYRAQAFSTLLLIGDSLNACQAYFQHLPAPLNHWTTLC